MYKEKAQGKEKANISNRRGNGGEGERNLAEEFDMVKANETQYEAVSWCWGTDPPSMP
jgi:hypothetical protein